MFDYIQFTSDLQIIASTLQKHLGIIDTFVKCLNLTNVNEDIFIYQ